MKATNNKPGDFLGHSSKTIVETNPLEEFTEVSRLLGEIVAYGDPIIPHNTTVLVKSRCTNLMKLENALTPVLSLQLLAISGPHEGKSFIEDFILENRAQRKLVPSEALQRSRRILTAIIESARDINPEDRSLEALQKRHVASYLDYQGLIFPVIVGERQYMDPVYCTGQDTNYIQYVITAQYGKYYTLMNKFLDSNN